VQILVEGKCGTGPEDPQREEFTGLCSKLDGGGDEVAPSVTLAWPQLDNDLHLIRWAPQGTEFRRKAAGDRFGRSGQSFWRNIEDTFGLGGRRAAER
jgi:hypothetical protein